MQSEPKSFPRLALVVPPLVPVAVVTTLLLTNAMGALPGGIHSAGGATLALLLWGSTLVAILVELVVLPRAAIRFLTDARLRTRSNALCVSVSVVFLLAALLWLVVSSAS